MYMSPYAHMKCLCCNKYMDMFKNTVRKTGGFVTFYPKGLLQAIAGQWMEMTR